MVCGILMSMWSFEALFVMFRSLGGKLLPAGSGACHEPLQVLFFGMVDVAHRAAGGLTVGDGCWVTLC